MSPALLILKIYTTFKDVQMMIKIFFDISTGFRFSKISVECSVHLCSCLYINKYTPNQSISHMNRIESAYQIMVKNLHCVNFAPAISKTVVRLFLLAVNIKIAVTFATAEEESSKTKKFSWSQCGQRCFDVANLFVS